MKPIMMVGTASDVGKSLVVTGVCRWLRNQGYRPAPFKAQNMSLNSYATHDGFEIGRAQAVQAEACGIPCRAEMNPILLKPSSRNSSQVVLNGKPIGDQSAKEYFFGNNKEHLFLAAQKAFLGLSKSYNPIVIEGAGSISELNLKDRDIVNMRMAQAANASVYLIADIDKGGVFGSVYGTIALLEGWERKLLKGIIINKFRGDSALFEQGRQKIEELTQYPVLGVLPYDPTIYLEEEDSVALSLKKTRLEAGKFNIAVVFFHHISNYTDFNALGMVPGLNVYYTRDPDQIKQANVIVLPGTKNTMGDLTALKEDGLDQLLRSCFGHIKIIGICGGFQMMGRSIHDPNHVESKTTSMSALGFFDFQTTLATSKRTVQTIFHFKDNPQTCKAYEIHMGKTEVGSSTALNTVNGRPEGYLHENGSWGTYLHGIFDNAVVVKDLVNGLLDTEELMDYQLVKEKNYDKLAVMMGKYLDMGLILKNSFSE